MRKNHLTLPIFLMIVMTDVGESIAQTFMKMGLNAIGINSITLSNLGEFILKAGISIYVWLGLLVFLVNFFIWITVLSRMDLSVAFPVGSFSFILVPILAMVFLHETISPLRWTGIALIIVGIHFVAKSTRAETMPL